MKKGLSEKSGPQLKKSVKTQFSSATFKKQLDKIIDDLYIFSTSYADKLINKSLNAGLQRDRVNHYLSASDTNTPDGYFVLTEEAVNECTDLSQEIVDSIIKVLKDEAIYQESIPKLANRVIELWGGQKYRAETWARTFTADVATNTTLHRYIQQGIEDCQFYATIDERTSPQCKALNGAIFKCESSEARQYKPPLHFRCRSTLLPIPSTVKVDDKFRYENRNFTKTIGQDLKFSGEAIDPKDVKKIFKNIDTFKEKYAIPKYILDADTERRLIKTGGLSDFLGIKNNDDIDIKLLRALLNAKIPEGKDNVTVNNPSNSGKSNYILTKNTIGNVHQMADFMINTKFKWEMELINKDATEQKKHVVVKRSKN